MRKLAVWMQMSLDGYGSAPDGVLNWPVVSDELTGYWLELIEEFDTMLYGRRVYELMAGYWPAADKQPNADAYAKSYAPIWRDMAKIVFSRTLSSAKWNTTIVSNNIVERVNELKSQPGKDMALFGGPEIVATLIQLGLVDEYRLFIHPVVLKGGSPLFGAGYDRTKLDLVQSRQFGNGVIGVHYRTVG